MNKNQKETDSQVEKDKSERSKFLIQDKELTYEKDIDGQYIELGNGGFGKVYIGKYNGSKVAIKKIEIRKNGSQKEDILKEIGVILSIRHTNNCNIYGYVEKENAILIVIEYYTDGNLCDILSDDKINVDLEMKKSWLLQIAQGINYLHCKNPPIMHRDLKPENIFLTNGLSRPVIGDFGLSKPIHSRCLGKLNTIVGTILWMAPEVLTGSGYDLKADVYSFGIIMYEVLTRLRPFKNVDLNNPNEFQTRVLAGERPDLNTNKLSNINHELIYLMKMCWDSNPLKRPDFEEIVVKLSNLI